MERISISVDETIERVLSALEEQFPGALFAIRNDSEQGSRRDLLSVDLVWVDGPSREEVEDALDRFQGVTWDPRSGTLESRSHFQVGPDGRLQEVFYDLDYIFCDGPTRVMFS